METVNPYSPPEGQLLDKSGEYGTIKVFSAKGRIGRLRYLGYSIGISLLVTLLMGILLLGAGFVLPEPLLFSAVVLIYALGWGAVVVINVLLTIQRCHDFNVTGWLSLFLLILLAYIVFWLIPGSQGDNEYGAQPPPNRGIVVILVAIVIVLFIMVVGILAAVAIPAYQEYLLRAQEMQG